MGEATGQAGETITRVRKYGCPSWADVDPAGLEQLRLAHQLRNHLVAVERVRDEMAAAVWLSIPEVADAQRRVDDFTRYCEEMVAVAKRERVAGQTTLIGPVTKAGLAVARKGRLAAKANLKRVKDEHRELMRQRRAVVDAAYRCATGRCNSAARCRGEHRPGCHCLCLDPATPRLYDEWVVGRGLGYGTFAETTRRHREATRRVVAARTAGQPAERRFAAWRGEGTLSVQTGFGERVAASLWSLDGDEATPRHATLRLRVGRGTGHGQLPVELPVTSHRPVGDPASVRWVHVTRRTVAGKARLSVQLTQWLPPPPPRTAGEVVDVDLGWSSVPGGVRVARVASASGTMPPVPADLAGVLVAGDWWSVVAPAVWRDLLARDDAIRSERSRLLDELRPGVVAALADEALAGEVGFGAAAARLMGFAKFDRLAWRWPAGHVTDPDLHQRLVETIRSRHRKPELARKLAGASTPALWRTRDRHLWTFEANERRQVLDRRRDAYRKVAAWVCGTARLVVIKDIDVADLKRRPDVTEEDTHQARAARRLAQFAAPHELRVAIEHAATARGVTLLYRREEEGTDGQA